MRCKWTTILETGATKLSKTLYNPRNTFHNFTLLLLSLFLPAPFPLPVFAVTGDVVAVAAAVADAISLASSFPRFVANLFAGARFSWLSSFSFRLSNASSCPYFLPCWLYASNTHEYFLMLLHHYGSSSTGFKWF